MKMMILLSVLVSVSAHANSKLFEAVKAQDASLVRSILDTDKTVNINYRGSGLDQDTALTKAARLQNVEIVKMLVAYPGIKLDAPGNLDTPAIENAVEYAQTTEVFDILYALQGDSANLNHLFFRAIRSYDNQRDARFALVKFLMQKPAIKINSRENDGYTPLMFAAWNGRADIVEFLLAQPGIEILLRSEDGETALDMARRKDCWAAEAVLAKEYSKHDLR